MRKADCRGPGCWNCGSLLHHHHDCDSDRDRRSQTGSRSRSSSRTPSAKESDSGNDRYGYACSSSKRSPTPPTPKDDKWTKTVNEKDAPPLLPREFLSTEMGKSLYILEEIRSGLDSIQELTSANHKNILEEAMKIDDKFKRHWKDMDDLVAHARNYERIILDAGTEGNTSDKLFKHNLEKIDKKRQDLWACCGQLIVTLRKIGEIVDDVTSRFAVLFAEIDDGHKLFGEGDEAAIPAFYDLEVLAESMLEPYSILKECRGQVNKLETLCSAADVREKLELIQESIDLIWEKRRAALRQQLLPDRRN